MSHCSGSSVLAQSSVQVRQLNCWGEVVGTGSVKNKLKYYRYDVK